MWIGKLNKNNCNCYGQVYYGVYNPNSVGEFDKYLNVLTSAHAKKHLDGNINCNS